MTDHLPLQTDESSEFVYNEVKEAYTTWKNNNDKTARFQLVTDEKKPGSTRPGTLAKPEEARRCKMTCILKVELAPGKTLRLPTKYDQAIRWVSPKTGEAVQGLCPWLTKVGQEDIVVHSSLDYKSAMRDQEALDMVAVMKRKNELQEALAQLEKLTPKS
jgi:hypothetical protein